MIVDKEYLEKLQIISEISISYSNKISKKDRLKVRCPNDSKNFVRNLYDSNIEYREKFYTIFLNRANEILGFTHISTGGTAGTVVDPKIIFQAALKANAASIIICHNHPSGNEKPSEQDISITKKLKLAGELLDIVLLDHIIVTVEDYYSFSENMQL